MKVNEQALKDYLAKMPNAGKCPLCGKRQWVASNQLFKLSKYKSDNIYDKCLPVFPIYCENCGYLFFVNPMITGLL